MISNLKSLSEAIFKVNLIDFQQSNVTMVVYPEGLFIVGGSCSRGCSHGLLSLFLFPWKRHNNC